MRGLSGRVSLVVGAAPGNIGAAAALRLAEEGSSVVVADLNNEAAEAVAEQIRAAGGDAIAHVVDISSEDSYGALVAFTKRERGGVDNLFQVAADLSSATMGVDGESDILTIPKDVWNRTLEVDLTGYMIGAQQVLPSMLERGGGSIVNTMSAAAWLADPIRPAYSTAKMGIAALTRHIASAMGKRSVRCNAVAPGLVLTDTALRVIPEASREAQLAALPTARLGTPEDIGAIVAFLCSSDAEWINGQTFNVDGGRVMR